jgi:hypothetical protein
MGGMNNSKLVIDKKVIIFTQTKLQQMIACEIIKKFPVDDVIVIEVDNYRFTLEGRNYFINLYGIKHIFETFNSFKTNNIHLKCDILIGNLLASYSSFFFVSFIQYSRLILMDDGIGTLVLLKHPNYFNTLKKHVFKNVLMRFYYWTVFNSRFKISTDYFDDIKFYYTIYDIKPPMPFEKLTVFKKLIHIIHDKKCFIGQPVVEDGFISGEKYIRFLIDFIGREGDIVYYGHPREHFLENVSIKGLTFYKKDEAVEKYFEEEGAPEYIYSFYSSTLLNLKIQNPELKLTFITNDFAVINKEISNTYKEILVDCGIQEYCHSLTGGK